MSKNGGEPLGFSQFNVKGRGRGIIGRDMKLDERNKSLDLREKGWSIKQIAEYLNVSKGSVSYWIRGLSLSEAAMQILAKRKIIGYERQRQSRFKNADTTLNILVKGCEKKMGSINNRDLFIAGIMLYAGEGTKRRAPQSQRVEFTNSDPALAKIFVEFLIRCCDVSSDLVRPRLFLYEDMDEGALVDRWAKLLNIPKNQFSNSQVKTRTGGTPGRKSEYGTIHIEVFRKKLLQQILGWISSFFKNMSGCGPIG